MEKLVLDFHGIPFLVCITMSQLNFIKCVFMSHYQSVGWYFSTLWLTHIGACLSRYPIFRIILLFIFYMYHDILIRCECFIIFFWCIRRITLLNTVNQRKELELSFSFDSDTKVQWTRCFISVNVHSLL